MKKQLPTDGITKELAQSVFFQKPAGEQAPEQATGSAQASPTELPPPRQAKAHHSPAPAVNEQPQQARETQKDGDSSQEDGKTDVIVDVMTLLRHDINRKAWQEVIENTETQNSALRLTSAERYAVEDVVNDLRRKYGIKTSMNEIARLGLLLLIHDFKQHKKESLIHEVKKA